jgi:hypothetical protein
VKTKKLFFAIREPAQEIKKDIYGGVLWRIQYKLDLPFLNRKNVNK